MHKSIQDVSCGCPGILSAISFLGTVSFPVNGNPGEAPEIEEVILKVSDPHNSTQASSFEKARPHQLTIVQKGCRHGCQELGHIV